MSAILTAIVFVKSVSGTNAMNGVATARVDDEEYVDIQYKAFNVNNGGLIETIQANSIMLFVGKYAFQESRLYITLIKSTLLDLKTLGERPSLCDLPVSPLLGAVTGSCSVPSRNQDGRSYFTLSRRTYNPFTGEYIMMDVPCFYESENNRHTSVANTTNSKAIFSTAGELFVGKKLVQMFASEIEWTYPSIEKSNTDKDISLRKKLKSRHLDFEDKYIRDSKNRKKRVANYDGDYSNMEESSTRAQERHVPADNNEGLEEVSPIGVPPSRSTRLADAMNVVTNNDKNNKGKDRDVLYIENESSGKVLNRGVDSREEFESSDTE